MLVCYLPSCALAAIWHRLGMHTASNKALASQDEASYVQAYVQFQALRSGFKQYTSKLAKCV